MTVAIVLVSHSAAMAQGLAELAGQMAPDVTLIPAGGLPDGGLGSSLDDVTAALRKAAAAASDVVVLADLGSSVLTVESALELEEDLTASAVLAPGPFVEGAVAAAVAAHGGSDVDGVVAAVRDAGGTFARAAGVVPDTDDAAAEAGVGPVQADAADGGADSVTTTATLRNPLGLHARPAALVSRKVAELGASVLVDGVDASSVLQLMALGATQGRELTITVSGPDAAGAARILAEMIGSGFGEV
ncbi:dihydroxyacetone kinase phosphoryl donor subunit DhaM [Myceligenerans pegani]|uniref:Phosphocarrier protein HPr n=1 Tax=Myceligenerans pegani TaxID=2776917 RepID=A0ABR9MXY7_9MICO|nr:dihydroxyacetone kinase phosphoryl donor subunit DhaM [Myceligenerans sp. TRM 65318]MBE1876244.1 HPr family phosphocarrier protein [Myceligenerans sp. TRM 65318]MBE3018515.1 HPr family phosphocarrier protein [Myceligenerans sp. TRM 65318]